MRQQPYSCYCNQLITSCSCYANSSQFTSIAVHGLLHRLVVPVDGGAADHASAVDHASATDGVVVLLTTVVLLMVGLLIVVGCWLWGFESYFWPRLPSNNTEICWLCMSSVYAHWNYYLLSPLIGSPKLLATRQQSFWCFFRIYFRLTPSISVLYLQFHGFRKYPDDSIQNCDFTISNHDITQFIYL